MAAGIFYYHGVFATIITSITIIGNLFTIIAFFRIKMLQLNPSNRLILALSIADLLYAAFVLVFAAIPYAFLPYYPYGEIGCSILVAGSNFYVVGNLILVAISVDRLLLVSLAYSTYTKIQTRTRINLSIGVCYAMGLVSALFELSLWQYAKKTNPVAAAINFSKYCFSPARFTRWFGLFYSLGLFCFPVLLIGILSGVFFCLLRVRIQKVANGRTTSSNAQPNVGRVSTVSGNVAENSRRNDEEVEPKSRYIKAAVTLAALVAALGICILPYCMYIIVGIFCSECTSVTALYIILNIVHMNPLLDPIFYSATQRNIREYYKSKCKKVLKFIRQ